jgi:hypothetical protein
MNVISSQPTLGFGSLAGHEPAPLVPNYRHGGHWEPPKVHIGWSGPTKDIVTRCGCCTLLLYFGDFLSHACRASLV